MRRLVERGLLTAQEREVLVHAEVPATQRHNAVLLWITRVFVEGWQAGHFIGGTGFENQLLEKIHVCRAQYGAIGDELAGRMPLAYAHIVQVLVDCVLWFYPFMAIASQMSDGLVILGTGLLTICYQGLFDLAKQFLDPYDNESYGKGEDPLVVDTLIAETNSGSVRWMNSLNEFPVSSQQIKDGELSDYMLPVRGYSVDELAEMEEDRKQRERELQERREREERERRMVEEKAARLRQAAEAMVPALMAETPTTVEEAPQITLERINGAPDIVPPTKIIAPFTFSSAEAISNVVANLNSMAGGIPSSLLPQGTAASREEDKMVIEQRERQAREEARQPPPLKDDVDEIEDEDSMEESEGDDNVLGDIEDFDNDGFEVLDDWAPEEENYVHSFELPDGYKDLDWFDEVGPDGQEIRLSQMLADEEWEEEKEAALEKQPPVRSFEEYSQRIEELRNATSSELAETEAILSAAPNAQSDGVASRGSKDELLYDQTKLDGISQLWGSPPGELSELPSYSEPEVSGETEFRSIMQLTGAEPPSLSQPARSDVDYDQDDIESPPFSSIGSLWGGFDDDDDADISGGAARPLREGAKTFGDIQSQQNDIDASWGTFRVSPTDGSEVRLSQILADEVWDEEEEEEEFEAPDVVSSEEYAQQIADILEAEKEEQLETEAILNAPSFAEFVGTSEEDDDTSKSVQATNSTLEDELSVLEMDVIDEELDDSTGSDSDTVTIVPDDLAGDVDAVHQTDEGNETIMEMDSLPNGIPASSDVPIDDGEAEIPTEEENPPSGTGT